MGKVPLIARQGTRYEPYSDAVLARRRLGSPSPDRWGIRAGSHQAQVTDGLFGLLNELKTRYGGQDLRELLRDHANQPGALGQSIGMWIQYEEIRGRRKLEPTEFIKTQLALQASPPRHRSEYPEVPTTNGDPLQNSPRASCPPERPLYTSPNSSPTRRTGDEVPESPQVVSLLRVMRGETAPPLISLPPSGPSAVHGGSNWSDEPVVNGHNGQGYKSPRSSEESYHAAFWQTAGWTAENGYQGFGDDGPRIPPHLKGKGRARLVVPKEGGERPEEQGSSGCGPPQPADPPYGIPALAPHVDMEPVSPEIPTIIQPQDEDSIPITWHQEGKRDGNEEHEHEQRPPQPESQPEPRRSERIKAINKRQDALPPKVKTSAKSTGRKRAVRKK